MTVVIYGSSEPQQDIPSTNWTEVASINKTLEGEGEYMIWANSEYAGENVGEVIGARVLLDGAEVAIDHFSPVLSDQFKTFSPFGMVTLTAGPHTVSLEVRCVDVSQTVKVRRIRLLVMKH